MELLIRKSQVSDVPIRREKNQEFIPGGILNSSYKQVVKQELGHIRQDSIYASRNKSRNQLHFSSLGIEIMLKVAVFAVALAFII